MLQSRAGNEPAKTKRSQKRVDPGSNQGPLDLQSNALPTELSTQRRAVSWLLSGP